MFVLKDRLGAVVKVTPLSQKVLGSTWPHYMQGKFLPRLFLPQTPLKWEQPALGLSFFPFTTVFILTLNYVDRYLDNVEYSITAERTLSPPRVNKYTKKELADIASKCKAKSTLDYGEALVSNN